MYEQDLFINLFSMYFFYLYADALKLMLRWGQHRTCDEAGGFLWQGEQGSWECAVLIAEEGSAKR